MAVETLGALAQETRLEIFRTLVREGRAGLPAGRIAERCQLAAPTLSFHLAQLKQARLVDCRRDGRRLIYSANYASIEGLLAYLMKHCCTGAGAARGLETRDSSARGARAAR